MLDIRLLREEPELVKKKLATRGIQASVIDQILELDGKRRELLQVSESAKARRNEISKLIPQKAKAKEPIDDLKRESKELGEKISTTDGSVSEVEELRDTLMMSIPNIPHESTPIGDTEEENVVVRSWGNQKEFPFDVKAHWDLGEQLGILDLPRGAKVTGSGFYVMRGELARLERVLIQWMLDTHTEENGYTEVSVPYLVNRESLLGTSQLPKFEDQQYYIEGDDLFLIPTAEVPVTNLYAKEIIEGENMPLMMCGHTPCFRREAGAGGRENRGISRIHQFHKVEMVQIVKPETSYEAHERLTGHAEALIQALDLPYRVLQLCTGDMGFAAAKCYDLELWAPGMDTWLEVSSCSNFECFQARRANMRYREEKGGKPEFVHTLNGSGLALPRLMIAIMENYQNEDGTITVPKALQKRFGKDIIGK